MQPLGVVSLLVLLLLVVHPPGGKYPTMGHTGGSTGSVALK